MGENTDRTTVLFLPVVRGRAYNLDWTRDVLAAVRSACERLGIDAIFPPEGIGLDGLLGDLPDEEAFYAHWRPRMADIKGVIAFSSDFMRERVIQDTLRRLPPDVPAFLMVNNDCPADVTAGGGGDSLCGSLSVHHNARMLGRPLLRSCRIDMDDPGGLDEFLSTYVRIMDGIECLRNMRLGMIGVNPDSFATTFTNQLKLFELGFSLHTYELLTLWGDTALAAQLAEGQDAWQGPFGDVKLWRPVAGDDERVEEVKSRLGETLAALPEDERKVDAVARCFLWIQDVFQQDAIDAGAIHCWAEFPRFFGLAPCSVAMLCNLLLRRPVVCEQDICHAVMAKLAWPLTGEAGVILDINNNGPDRRVFNAFHCSQTPPNWLAEAGRLGGWGGIEGAMAPGAFTGISAATTSDDFLATVFHGRFLRGPAPARGGSGWAFVPNLPEVLEAVEAGGIHHFVALKGHLGGDVADVLRFRGLNVTDLSRVVPSLDEIEAGLPEMKAEARTPACRVYSS